MRPEDYISTAAGTVVRMPEGHHVSIPTPPTRAVDYTAIARDLSAADAAVGELSGIGRVFPNPDLLIAPYVRREAVASSRIEGTQADLDDLLLEEATATGKSTTDAYEIRNYITALNYGITALATLPLASRLMNQMHRLLLAGVRGKHKAPGEVRRSQNWLGGSSPASAVYVPPPPDRVLDLLADWERFINARDDMPDLVRCAIAHEHFETIHPYLDGNGRMGRLISH